MPTNPLLDLSANTQTRTLHRSPSKLAFKSAKRSDAWYTTDLRPPWMDKSLRKREQQQQQITKTPIPTISTTRKDVCKPNTLPSPRKHPSSPLAKQSYSASTATSTSSRQVPPLPRASPSVSTPTLVSMVPLLPSPSSSLTTLASTTLRKRPHSAESIMKWMDERLQQRAQAPPFPRPPSPPSPPVIPPPQSQPAVAPPRMIRSSSSATTTSSTVVPTNARQVVATNTARILSSLSQRESTKTKSVTRQRSNSSSSSSSNHNNSSSSSSSSSNGNSNNSSSSSVGVLGKARKYNPTEWPNVLSEGADESDRLVAQHYILRTAFRGDFCAPTRSVMERGAVVLDVGCGPGTWTMEMATAYPASTFIGVDIRQDYPCDIKPKNSIFRQCDITQLPLPFPDNSIDYIFHRDLNWHLAAHLWAPLIKEYFRVLRPGGWLELVEPDLETQSSGPLECAINDKLIHGLSMRRQDPFVARRLSTLLAMEKFRRIEGQFQSLPLGWGSSHATGTVPDGACSPFATAVTSHYMFLLQSLKPWLSVVTNYGEKYNQYIPGLAAEWKRCKTYVNWYRAIGQKPRH